jgi:hypothetical protein
MFENKLAAGRALERGFAVWARDAILGISACDRRCGFPGRERRPAMQAGLSSSSSMLSLPTSLTGSQAVHLDLPITWGGFVLNSSQWD